MYIYRYFSIHIHLCIYVYIFISISHILSLYMSVGLPGPLWTTFEYTTSVTNTLDAVTLTPHALN